MNEGVRILLERIKTHPEEFMNKKKVKFMSRASHLAIAATKLALKDANIDLRKVNAAKIEYEGKPADLVVFRDISERKEMEKKLKEYAEQLEEKVKERTRSLRESEEKARILLENLPQKIFFKDKNSVYISCNENYAQDLKIKPDEIAGRTDYDFYPKKLAEKYRAELINLNLIQKTSRLVSEKNCKKELKLLGVKLPEVKTIPRITMRKAQQIIFEKTGRDNRDEPDLEPEDEKEICAFAKEKEGSEFVFITHYPRKKPDRLILRLSPRSKIPSPPSS
jgi:PAS domain-containing protein